MLYFPQLFVETKEEGFFRIMERAVQPRCSHNLSHPLILVADDEPFILQYIERVLQVANYRVITANRVEDAWKILERHQSEIELVLTDIVMPGSMDGLELADKIHQFAPGLPVLFITGALSELDPCGAAMVEKQLLLRKPFFPNQLVEFVGAQTHREPSVRVAR
jgi:two-component system, cell cycle sensor histidine kinase and response regulator CckA